MRLAERVANTEVAIASTLCTGLYPVFFAQSSLAQVDLAAAGLLGRAKRRLRSLYRQHQNLVSPGLDLVLTARAALLRLDFAEAARRFVSACGKLPIPSQPKPNV